MTSYVLMLVLGAALIAGAAVLGGRPAAVGGLVALGAQTWAVMLLKPALRGPNPAFMARWLGGIGIRALACGALVLWSATHRGTLPLVATTGGFLGVLLPLLFLETRFLR